MRSWGLFLIIMAVGSVLLPRIGIQFIVLAWIDTWGPGPGWIIRGVLLVLGIGLLVKASASDASRGGA